MGERVIFRAGVVIVVRRPTDGAVLAFERGDSPGHWQLPQGGIEGSETPLQAALRELHEETGLTIGDVALTGEHPEWLACEWPDEVKTEKSAKRGAGGRILGQVHRWFVFDVLDAEVQPRPDRREFIAWKWVAPQWLATHVIEMRREAYQRVLATLER